MRISTSKLAAFIAGAGTAIGLGGLGMLLAAVSPTWQHLFTPGVWMLGSAIAVLAGVELLDRRPRKPVTSKNKEI